MRADEFWKNFKLGSELDISGRFIYNGLKAFDEMKTFYFEEDAFEFLYNISVGIERLFKIWIILEVQSGKLLSMLATLVNYAGKQEKLKFSHAGYGVQDEHYDILKDVLVHVIVNAMGDDLTAEDAALWVRFYDMVAAHMRPEA